MKNKTVLLVLQSQNDIIKHFRRNLEHLGYEVTAYPETNYQPYTLTIFDKVQNILSKYLKKNNASLQKKKAEHQQNYYLFQENNTFKNIIYDYTIVFRPDLLDANILEKLKATSDKMIAYQWDGMKRYPLVFDKIRFFDNFFCFNPEDESDQVKFLPNFYFDYLSIPKIKPDFDITYIGYYYDDRFDLLERLGKTLINFKINFLLKSFSKEQTFKIENSANIQLIKEVYSYEELLEISNRTNVLLDIKHSAHSGLSFRFFEGIQLQKKIITTNASVVEYDFYHPDNIFILDQNYDPNQIKSFFEKKYHRNSKEIVEKYSFTNWFKNLINSEKKVLIQNPYKF